MPCKPEAHLSGRVSFGVYECAGAFTEKEKAKQGGGKIGAWITDPPNHPIPFRLCCYFPTDLCHLATDLNFGTSSMWNASTHGSARSEMKGK